MRKSDFSKFINSLNEEELKSEIENLFDNVAGVKDYYAMELGSDKDRIRIFENAKKMITKYYATKSYRKPKAPRIRYIQNLLKEITQLSIFNHELVDLYLHDVETAVAFMRSYYFSSKSLTNNAEKSFQSACELIQNGNFQSMFLERVEQIMKDASKLEEIYWAYNKTFLSTFRQQNH